MARQSKSKKPENIGKGKVTPVQIAFIVDRYLSDNNFTETRSTFRSEATSLISKTNVKEAPKSLMSLDAILDEYICLKEQKVILEQEKVRVEQEKCRVETLLQGMQSAMQAYNNSSKALSPETKAISMSPPTDLNSIPNPYIGSPSGHATNITPTVTSIPWTTQNNTVEPTNFSTPSTSLPPQNKRKSARLASDAPTVPKRTRRQAATKAPSSAGTKAPLQARNSKTTQKMVKHDISASHPTSQTNAAVSCLVGSSSVHDSSVAKNLFKQSSPSHPSNSPSPKTPPQECNSQIDNSISPLEKSSVVNSTCNYTPQDTTPNCAVITSTETVMVSPTKHVTCYAVERSHYFSAQSPAKSHLKRLGARDHVKGRLDFGGSDTAIGSNQMMMSDVPTSEAAGDIFDMDMPNFDIFGPDFSLSEFLVDMELNCGQGTKTATNNCSGSTEESELGKSEAIETSSEYHSSVSEILCEKDMNVSGQNGSSSVKSIMKCVTITSPAKIRRSSALGQENLETRN